jgi:MFS family permease
MGHLYRICVPFVDREGSLGRRSINVLLVALGGAIGPAARYLMGTFIANRFDPDFPWGTCIVNVSGSFVIGAILSLVGGGLLPAGARLFLAVGILEATRRSRPTHMRRSNSSRTASLGRPRPTLSVRSSRGSPLSIWV